jgi:hypothetical protein
MEINAGRERMNVLTSICPRGKTKSMRSRRAKAKDPVRTEQQHLVKTAAGRATEKGTTRDVEATRGDGTRPKDRESHHHVDQVERARTDRKEVGNNKGEEVEGVTHREDEVTRKAQTQGRAEKGKAKVRRR